jgi:hypothetical protein
LVKRSMLRPTPRRPGLRRRKYPLRALFRSTPTLMAPWIGDRNLSLGLQSGWNSPHDPCSSSSYNTVRAKAPGATTGRRKNRRSSKSGVSMPNPTWSFDGPKAPLREPAVAWRVGPKTAPRARSSRTPASDLGVCM